MKERKIKNLILTSKKLNLTNMREGNWNFPNMRLNLQVKNQLSIIHKNIKILVKVVIVTKRKRNTNCMKTVRVNSKRSNLLFLTERSRMEKKQNLGYLE